MTKQTFTDESKVAIAKQFAIADSTVHTVSYTHLFTCIAEKIYYAGYYHYEELKIVIKNTSGIIMRK